MQAGINLASNTTITGFAPLSYSEAFDEPLDMPQVLAIAKTFATATSTFFG